MAENPNARAGAKLIAHMLQEVLAAARPRAGHMPLVIAHSTKQLERRLQILSDLTHRSEIATPVTVVRSTPHRDHILVREMVFISFVHQLMRTGDERKIVNMAELIGDTITKEPACTTRTDRPCLHVVGIGPDKITECTFMRNFLRTGDHSHLIQGADFWTQSSVNAQDFPVDDGAQRHEIEDLATSLPYRGTAVFLETFFVEAVHLCDLAGFVVSAY